MRTTLIAFTLVSRTVCATPTFALLNKQSAKTGSNSLVPIVILLVDGTSRPRSVGDVCSTVLVTSFAVGVGHVGVSVSLCTDVRISQENLGEGLQFV